MAHVKADRVKETTTTTGVGALTLGGAPTGFRTFASQMVAADTCFYAIDGGAEWEVGIGTFNTTLTRTTVLASSNANAAVNLSAGTKTVFINIPASKLIELDADLAYQLPAIVNEPPTPPTGILSLYARKVAGRMLPKIKGPSGLDTCMQTAFFQNRILLYVPSTGTTGTGSGSGLGPVWTAAGTVNHPTPSNAAPAMANQMRRTRYANVVTTADQPLGIRPGAADTLNYWIGNAVGLGGFFFAARFIVELIPAASVRVFAGMCSSTTLYAAASNTMINNSCGLWHDTADPLSGLGAFNFVTRDTVTTTKQQINLATAIAAGSAYDFYCWVAPNGTTIFWRLDDVNNNVTYEGSQTLTLPANTAFMGPQCAMSNGANVVVTTTAIGIAGVYTESDR